MKQLMYGNKIPCSSFHGIVTTLGLIGLIGLSVLSVPAGAADDSQHFVIDAIQGNLAEVKMGQLAQQRGASPAVRSYGSILENDHASANVEAIKAAQAIGVTAPTEPSAKQKSTYEQLSKLSGDNFDKEFAKDMVDDHKMDITKYQTESQQSDAVGTYAKQTLPTLKKHLQAAQSLTSAPQ